MQFGYHDSQLRRLTHQLFRAQVSHRPSTTQGAVECTISAGPKEIWIGGCRRSDSSKAHGGAAISASDMAQSSLITLFGAVLRHRIWCGAARMLRVEIKVLLHSSRLLSSLPPVFLSNLSTNSWRKKAGRVAAHHRCSQIEQPILNWRSCAGNVHISLERLHGMRISARSSTHRNIL